jgi:diguanylate cyclase (GGDEF)-like protein
VIFLDLDDFKTINDTFGHALGDELLPGSPTGSRTAWRGRRLDRRRLGGDEFAAVVTAPADVEERAVGPRAASSRPSRRPWRRGDGPSS